MYSGIGSIHPILIIASIKIILILFLQHQFIVSAVFLHFFNVFLHTIYVTVTQGQPFVTINSISAGLSVASTLAQAQKAIQQIKGAGPGSTSGISGGTGGGAVNIPTTQAPSFNIVGSDSQNQLAQTLATQTQKPVKAFVVSGDVTTAQSLDRNIIQESSLG